MTNACVLIVEDDRRVGFELQHYLHDLGFHGARISLSASRRLERAAELHPDLVLMDARLSGAIDGIAAADLIQSRFDIP